MCSPNADDESSSRPKLRLRAPPLPTTAPPPPPEPIPVVKPKRADWAKPLLRRMRRAFNLALLALIVALLWVFVPGYRQRQARERGVSEAQVWLTATDAPKAVAALLRLDEQYPNDREIWFDLAQAYVLAHDNANAVVYAERYAKWEPTPVHAASWRDRVYRQFFTSEAGPISLDDRTTACDWVLEHGWPADSQWNDRPNDTLRALALQTLAINPQNRSALYAAAHQCLLRNQGDEAIGYAQRGVQLDPNDARMRVLLAEICLMKKDWARLISECDAVLAMDPENEHIRTMRALAERANNKRPSRPSP
jgi:tetratricopeptide (TPR) repeat protein